MNTGVVPVHKNKFKIGKDSETATNIADIESFSVAFDNGVEEWTPMETEGWIRRLMTAKSITITLTGKRNIGDKGNDYVADKAMLNGRDVESYFMWEFPNGKSVVFNNAIINVINLGSGDSTGASPLEFEVLSNGQPVLVPTA